MAQKRISRAELVFRRLKASDRHQVYAGLLWIVRLKGRKRGFAAHKFKAIFGDWPRFGDRVQPVEPTSDLLTWLERERRRYVTAWKKERLKIEAAAKIASATAYGRINAILVDLEANPLAREPCCSQETDSEALDIASRICAKLASVSDSNAT